jgi:hypothetical protein
MLESNNEMTDEATLEKWRIKAARRYERIKADPVAYARYVERMRNNARNRRGTTPEHYRGKHRIGKNRNRKLQNRAFVKQKKLEAGACHDCGLIITENTLYKFEYDHRDPMSKTFALSASGTYSKETILKEIEKCDVVCRNCHADRTYGPQAATIRAKQSQGRNKRKK